MAVTQNQTDGYYVLMDPVLCIINITIEEIVILMEYF